MKQQRHGKRLMSDMNVVPYIDVMLVLLIIFMITAPLVTQGVKVELPEAPSKPIDNEQQEPVTVSVDQSGAIYFDWGGARGDAAKPIDEETLQARVAAFHKNQPEASIYVRGDRAVDYGRVVEVMTLLQQAGVDKVGLLSTPVSGTR
ncbi:MAG: protein TolR [Gammaproteobacteria bacterium]|nr:protein TolR [Gammaproteobacteria bacterium]